MKKIKNVFIAAFLITTLACNAFNSFTSTAEPAPTYIIEIEPEFPTQSPQNDVPLSEASVPRVSIEETRVALAAGAAIIVDVRSPSAYELSHIPGAINIPLGEIETNPTGLDLDKDQWIITYCT
jgi:3-mercaptopyruvate sulfurtransferase SseA